MTPGQLLVRLPIMSTLLFTAITKFSIELMYRSHRKIVTPTDINEDGNFCVIRSKGNW
jgi:hypothetical protein